MAVLGACTDTWLCDSMQAVSLQLVLGPSSSWLGMRIVLEERREHGLDVARQITAACTGLHVLRCDRGNGSAAPGTAHSTQQRAMIKAALTQAQTPALRPAWSIT